MSEMATAYVQIVPSAKGITGSIKNVMKPEAESAGKESGQSLGSGLVSTLKNIIVAAGIGNIIKDALDAGGAVQQSFGGLDTLYGEASSAAKDYAREAAAAGISMNNYAEQAVSFGASLKSAFGGDVTKAAEAANTAILDMADNSAKMGTEINSVQAAYQGFAKQNYTMLDNLKLGYGGTKTEMQRLLKDAEKLSGVKYDINNLGDVYSAIHVIQEELGLTGVAAEEASSTFTGSMGAMKAAATNVLADLTTGGDVAASLQVLTESAFNFFQNNLLPMIGNMLSSLPDILSTLISELIGLLNRTALSSGDLIGFATGLIASIAESLIELAPYLLASAAELASSLLSAMISFDWVGGLQSLVQTISDSMNTASGEIFGNDEPILTNLISAITAKIPELAETALEIITSVATFLIDNVPTVVQTGVEVVSQLANGLLTALPEVINSITEILSGFLGYVIDHLPEIVSMGINVVNSLAMGVIKNLPAIVSSVAQMITKFLLTVVEHLPQIVESGLMLLGQFVVGLAGGIPAAISTIVGLVADIAKSFIDYDWGSLGGNLVDGMADGIANAAGRVIDSVRDMAQAAWDAVTDFFDINSPSRKMRDGVGKMLDLGLADGIERYGLVAANAAEAIGKDVYNAMNDPLHSDITASRSATINLNVVGEVNGKAFLELVNNGLGVQL